MTAGWTIFTLMWLAFMFGVSAHYRTPKGSGARRMADNIVVWYGLMALTVALLTAFT